MKNKLFLCLCLVVTLLVYAVAAPLFQPTAVFAAAPDTPVNSSPDDGATGVSLTPTLEGSAFFDSDGHGPGASQWQIAGSTFTKSSNDGDITTYNVPQGYLTYGTEYTWQVMYQDDAFLFWAWSGWSTATSFTTVAAPQANFSATPTAADVGQTVTFTNSSSGGSGSLSYAWNFGDGETGTGATPTHAYDAAGTYTVTLTVTDTAGGTDTEEKTSYITVTAALVADFTAAPTSIVAGQAVTFTNKSSGGVAPLSYKWDFDKNGTVDSTAQSPSYAYSSVGTYTAELTVTDSTAQEAKKEASITVSAALVADFSTDNVLVSVGQTVAFANLSTGGVAPLKYQWDFDNNGTVDSTLQNPSSTYSVSGKYSVKLVITDSASTPNTKTVIKTNYITVTLGLQADFTTDRVEVALGQSVKFTSLAAGGVGTVTYEWDFDDDGTVDSTLQNPSYIYSSPGTFTVVLKAKDLLGTSEVNKPDYIKVTSGLLADFSADNTAVVVGRVVEFASLSGGGVTPLSYQWDFNSDGTVDSTVQNPSFTYTAAGTYAVSLKVTDSKGNSDTERKDGYITVYVLPQAGFSASATVALPGQAVTFTSSSTGGTPPLAYAWDFNGDGAVDSTSQLATYTYETAGIYTVSLKVTDSGGNTDTETKIGYVTVGNVAIAPHAIPPEGGVIQTADGRITATFPAGAYDGDATLTILEVSPSAAPAPPEGYKIGSSCFTVEATDEDGRAMTSLSRPATITMKYSDADMKAAGGAPGNLVLAYYSPATAKWTIVTTAFNETSQSLSATTTHFSTWAVLVKAPSTGLAWWIKVLIGLASVAVLGIVVWKAFSLKQPEQARYY